MCEREMTSGDDLCSACAAEWQRREEEREIEQEERRVWGEHTPGPWLGCTDGMSGVFDIWHDFGPDDVVQVAEVFGEDVDPRLCCQANARLIAAAPDMLAALEAALNYIDGCKNGESRLHARGILEAAIAKARGITQKY
jgi:hypothetical protein